MSLKQELFQLVQQIPHGMISGYGILGSFLSRPCSGLIVGKMMANLPPGEDVPWWRVVGADGTLLLARRSAALGIEQQQRLEEEGIIFFERGKVDVKQHPPFRDFHPMA